jgi:integrase
MLCSDYLVRWLETMAPTVRAASFQRYREVTRLHLVPRFGQVPLGTLSPLDIQDFYARKLADGLSERTVSQIHAVLRQALAQAVRWGMVPRNPCDAVTPPRPKDKEMQAWSEEETRTFINGVADDEYRALWLLAVMVGLRRGELIGLRWEDLDLQRGTATVRRTQTRDAEGRLIIGDAPKSASGRRTIQLPELCLSALKVHRARQNERRLQLGPAWQDTGAVFDRGDGTPCSDPKRFGYRFTRLIRELGLPRIRFHDLRHTAATNLLKHGTPVHVVAKMLGHANPSVTLRVYAHVLAEMQQDVANRLDALFGT